VIGVGGAAQPGDQMVGEEGAADLLRLEGLLVAAAGAEKHFPRERRQPHRRQVELGPRAPALGTDHRTALAGVEDPEAHVRAGVGQRLPQLGVGQPLPAQLEGDAVRVAREVEEQKGAAGRMVGLGGAHLLGELSQTAAHVGQPAAALQVDVAPLESAQVGEHARHLVGVFLGVVQRLARRRPHVVPHHQGQPALRRARLEARPRFHPRRAPPRPPARQQQPRNHQRRPHHSCAVRDHRRLDQTPIISARRESGKQKRAPGCFRRCPSAIFAHGGPLGG
jgi:hypothetical protein